MKSKEDLILKYFFEYPLKQWHFNELKNKIKIADSKLANWLKKFQKENIIQRYKPKGEMAYYISNHLHANYKNKKKMYAIKQLDDSGLLSYLLDSKSELIIIFGSIIRSDWHAESDIDIFMITKENIDPSEYEKKLKREIQIFSEKNKQSLSRYNPGLIRNILQGNIIKGIVPDEMYKKASEGLL